MNRTRRCSDAARSLTHPAHDWEELNLLWECPGTDVTTAAPAEIDTEIHRLDAERVRFGMYLTALRRELGESENQAAGYAVNRHVRPAAEILAAIEATETSIEIVNSRIRPLGEEFSRRGGWTRWYLVTDGHLHYDVSGSRCNRIPTTEHYWMTEHSGKTEAKMIEEAGKRVCTVCFPSAPVDPRPATGRFMTLTEAERAAYREQTARDRAAKKAAQITTPEGEELIVDGDHLKTERAAWNRAMQLAWDLAWYGEHNDAGADRESIRRILDTLAPLRGITAEALRAELNTKVAKKVKKDGLVLPRATY